VQKPHPEIVFGGHTPEAFSRAARLAKGWYGFALDLEGAKKCIAGVKEACAKAKRNFSEIEISVTPRGKIDLDTARRFAEAGVHRLILLQSGNDHASILTQVSEVGRNLIGKV
jgi:alkanesulfonate monooxygenase SsuD/methylene tetrahydromethanopterin reductase-like flavin-dependent oxidoreductase (luciferase family)